MSRYAEFLETKRRVAVLVEREAALGTLRSLWHALRGW